MTRRVEQDLGDGTIAAAPLLEYHEFSDDSAVNEVRLPAERAATRFPDMMSVRDAIKGLYLIF